MHLAMWLLSFAGVLSFMGFAFIALASTEATVFGGSPGFGSVLVSPLLPWGLGLLGLGVMLGFFGAAIKGPSVEWDALSLRPPVMAREASRPAGSRYACPECGGDVYTSQTACPECGRTLPAAPHSTG